MKRVLYDNKKNELIWVTVTVYNTPNDEIIIKGDESGIVVKKIMRNFHYEYYIQINQEEVQKLMQKINGRNDDFKTEQLLDWFESKFYDINAASMIMEKLKKLGIKYIFSTW